MSRRFVSHGEIIGVNPYVPVSAGKAAQLKEGHRRTIPVRFRINKSETTWRVNLMPAGDGNFRLYLNGEIRKALGVRVGDALKLEVQLDDVYKSGPLHPMPIWFRNSLSQNSKPQHGWELLTPGMKK